MNPSISIVVINLNNADGLRRTLESIVGQNGYIDHAGRFDVCVVDGLSHDESVPIARRIAQKNPGIQVFSEADDGVYDAMNRGIDYTAGDYLIFMNSGDRFGEMEALQTISSELTLRPTWLVVGATNLGGGNRSRATIQNLPHSWFRHAMGLQPHCHQASVFRRDLVTALGGYRCRFGLIGDFDFIVRSGAVTPPRELPVILVEYEGGGLSEHAWRTIPALQHEVRVDVLSLPGPIAVLDLIWSRYLLWRRTLSRQKARFIRYLRRGGPGPSNGRS